MKGRRNIIKVMAVLLALCTIISCVPFGMAFAADRPSDGGYSNFVDDSYSVTDEKTETVEKVITADSLVYTTSTSSTAAFSTYSKTLTANTMIPASLVKAYFTVDVYAAYKDYLAKNPNSVATLKEIRIEQSVKLAGGSSTVNVETGYSINGGAITADGVKPVVSAGEGIAINSSTTAKSSVTTINDETILSAFTGEDKMYLVWYVGQASKAMFYYAPSVTLVMDVYTKTVTDYNNDTTTANGSEGSFTNGVLDIDTTQKLTPESVTGQKFYLGAYNNGYVGSSSYGSNSGQIYTSVTSVKENAKNPKTNTVLDPAMHQKFSIPYKAPAYLNYDIAPYLDYIEASLVAQGKTNVKITITSVDLFAKVRMGYTGSYASSYAPYDDVAVSVAPSWTGSNYPSSNYQQTGDYFANYAYNVTVYLATSLTANQVAQLNDTKAMTVRIQSTDYYGYYDYISTLNYLWTLVEDYPTIAINYSYTCDNVEEIVVDNSIKTNLYAEHKFYDDDTLVMGKTKFLGTLAGVGAKATVTPYTSGTVNNLYTYNNGVQSYTNNGSAVVSADEYVLKRAYVDAGDGNVISIDSTSAKSSYTVKLLSQTQGAKEARVVFEYQKEIKPNTTAYECKSFDVKEDGGKLYFTVVTSPADINRIKIFDTTDAGSYVKLISTYTVDANGDYVWTASIAAPGKTTTYGADARANSDNKYLKNYTYATYTVPAEGGVSDTTYVKDATYKVEGGKVVFTVTTAPNSVNRVKVSAADATKDYLAYATKHTVDANGNWVWTITIDAPTTATNYAFDARLTSTGKYAKAYFYASVDPSQISIPESDTSIFTNVTSTVANGKVTFTVTSKKTVDINRVRVAPATAPTEYITYVSKCTTDASGNYVWTLTIDAPSADTVYAFDARLVSTGKYAKAYYYAAVAGNGSGEGGDSGNSGTVTPAPGATFKTVSASISGDTLTFVITTAPVAISRIKVMNSADMKTNLKLVSNYTVDANGNYVWVVSIDAPTAKTTYAFDARSSETGLYLKDYFYLEVNPSTVTIVDPEIKGVSHTVSGEQFVFTVTTTSANINRVKLCDANGKLISYVSQCTRNANGDFEWILATDVVKGESKYSFYMRDSLTGLYIDEGYDYTVKYDGPTVVNPDSPVESVSYTTNGGIVTFKVTTAAGAYNRLKVSYLNDLSTAIAYTDKYVVNEDGKYVWTLSVAQVGQDTTYSFDVRSSETMKYIKEYFDFVVPAGEVNPDVDSLVFKSISASVADGKLTFTVETYKGYNRIKVSIASAPSSYIKYTNNYTETADSQIWTITIDAPENTTAYSFAVRPVDGTSYLQERAIYVHTVVDTPKKENWGTINESGVYTAINGGYQIVLPGWVYYGNVDGSETVAASATAPTSCLFASIYDVVDSAIFDNYTKEDFEETLGYEITSFRKTTVGDGYTCYVYTIEGMYVYTFQTNTARYFLNFVQADDGVDVETISNTAMTNIIIYETEAVNPVVIY